MLFPCAKPCTKNYIFRSLEIGEYGEQFGELVQPTMDLVVGVMRQKV